MEPKVKTHLRIRAGHGFSIEELKQAGISLEKTKGLKLRIDKRRSSAYKENIEALKLAATKLD